MLKKIIVSVFLLGSSSFGSSHPYIGLGISSLTLEDKKTKEEFKGVSLDMNLGYQYNQYIGIEGHYLHNVSNIKYKKGNTIFDNNGDYPTSFYNVGLYLKPSYGVKQVKLYALLGFGSITFADPPKGSKDRTQNGFQWGGGVEYVFDDTFAVFMNYLNLYDSIGFDGHISSSDIVVDKFIFGVSYSF